MGRITKIGEVCFVAKSARFYPTRRFIRAALNAAFRADLSRSWNPG